MWQIILYVDPLSISLFILAITILSMILAFWSAPAPARGRKLAKMLLAVSLTVVLLATIVPTEPIGSGVRNIWLIPGDGLFGPGSEGLFPEERRMNLALSVANAAMFTPLAIFWHFSTARASVAKTLTRCLALSVGIEAIQFLMNAGRVVDIDDVIFNSTGAFVGILIAVASTALAARVTATKRSVSAA